MTISIAKRENIIYVLHWKGKCEEGKRVYFSLLSIRLIGGKHSLWSSTKRVSGAASFLTDRQSRPLLKTSLVLPSFHLIAAYHRMLIPQSSPEASLSSYVIPRVCVNNVSLVEAEAETNSQHSYEEWKDVFLWSFNRCRKYVTSNVRQRWFGEYIRWKPPQGIDQMTNIQWTVH